LGGGCVAEERSQTGQRLKGRSSVAPSGVVGEAPAGCAERKSRDSSADQLVLGGVVETDIGRRCRDDGFLFLRAKWSCDAGRFPPERRDKDLSP
jgi:hypothetical protein